MACCSMFVKNRSAFEESISDIMWPELVIKEEKPSFVCKQSRFLREKLTSAVNLLKKSLKLPINILDTLDGYPHGGRPIDFDTTEVLPEFISDEFPNQVEMYDSLLFFSIETTSKIQSLFT